MIADSARRQVRPAFAPAVLALLLGACGGGGSGDGAVVPGSVGSPAPVPSADGAGTVAPEGTTGPVVPDVVAGGAAEEEPDAPGTPPALDRSSATARYRVTLENLWGADDFPQDFPENAHLSLVGGALHDDTVSFWSPGTVVSRGMEDVAETGMIDILLDEEVAPAVLAGSAGAFVEVRRFTGPAVAGEPGRLEFEIEADARWPRLTLATMLGPSPDWFVGTDGHPLRDADGWKAGETVDLPLWDGGTKSDIVPVMGGADIIPPVPVALVAYDPATGTYLPSETPQTVARLVLERVR